MEIQLTEKQLENGECIGDLPPNRKTSSEATIQQTLPPELKATK